VIGSARAQCNKTTPADPRAIKLGQMAPAAIAAWEQRELFAAEIRAAFKSLR
jgi:hypothetical protein